jgi:sugar/nucleoside kinase (ribokinase family)
MKEYDVYAIGNAIVDYEIEIDDLFLSENAVEKGLMTLVDSARQSELLKAAQTNIRKKQGGGSAANTIVALSQLGGSGFYSCKVAADDDGRFYSVDLTKNGVDTCIDTDNLEKGETGKCLVMISPDAERTMNTFLGITADFSITELIPEKIKSSSYLFIEGYLVSSETGLIAMKEAKRIARTGDVKVSLTFSDPSMVKYFGQQMKEVVGSGVDLLFCNEEEAMLYTDTGNVNEAAELLKQASKEFIITKGNQGATIWDGTSFISVAAFPAKPIDTTGAGDIYSGAYLYGVTSGLSRTQAGKLASLAGARVVAQFGPRLDKTQLESILAESKQ